MVTGLYLDGWSHIHNKPETFFTPWHGVLYSGFGAAVAYFAIRGVVSGRRVEIDRFVRIGFGLFAAAAAGDFVWHSIFGIEAGLAALLSPTHLGLMMGGLLMLTGPIRSSSARGDDAPTFAKFLPTLVCFTLAFAVLTFFLQYDAAFGILALGRGNEQEGIEVWGVSAVLITNALMMGLALFMKARWRTPRGAFTFMFMAVAVGVSGLGSFRARHFVSAFVGGVVADLLADRDSRAFGALVPAATWTTWVVVMAIDFGIAWDAEIWTGAIFLASLSGLGLSVLQRSGALAPTRPSSVAGHVRP